MTPPSFDVAPISNSSTENFCQQVASEYYKSKESAEKMFYGFCKTHKLVRWETIALKDRISFLIKNTQTTTLS